MSHLGRSDAEYFVTVGSSFLVTCPKGGYFDTCSVDITTSTPCYVETNLARVH